MHELNLALPLSLKQTVHLFLYAPSPYSDCVMFFFLPGGSEGEQPRQQSGSRQTKGSWWEGGGPSKRGGMDDFGQRLGRCHDLRPDTHWQSSGRSPPPMDINITRPKFNIQPQLTNRMCLNLVFPRANRLQLVFTSKLATRLICIIHCTIHVYSPVYYRSHRRHTAQQLTWSPHMLANTQYSLNLSWLFCWHSPAFFLL